MAQVREDVVQQGPVNVHVDALAVLVHHPGQGFGLPGNEFQHGKFDFLLVQRPVRPCR